jgi:hypothetical protein
MASLSFTSAVSMRPVLAAKATKTIVSTKANALGGGGPNIPAADYKKKMEEKNKLIAANKAKAGAKAGAKKAAPTPAPAAKKVAAPAAKKVVVAKKPVVKKVEAKKVAPAKVSAGFALPVAPKGAYTIAGKK